MAGRKPIPDQIKLLRGTFRKGRSNDAQPQPEAGAPSMPEGLTDAEAHIWRRVVDVVPDGVLTKADVFALELFVKTYAEFLAVDELVKSTGRTIVTRDDKGQVISVRANPNLKHRTQLIPELRRLGEQLGLTPAARSRIKVAGEEPADPFGDLMARGGIAGGGA